MIVIGVVFFFQAEDGIRDLVRSRGLGDVYKRQMKISTRLLLQRLWYATAGCVCGAAVFASAAASHGLSLIHI